MQNKLFFNKILNALEIPAEAQVEIILNLNDALGYNVFKTIQSKLQGEDRRIIELLFKENNIKAIDKFICAKINKHELQSIIQSESEKLIKKFLQGTINSLPEKQRQKVLQKIDQLTSISY